LLYAAVASLPAKDIEAPRPIVFGSLLRTLHHVYAMDQVWRAHLEGRPHEYTSRNPNACPPFDTLRSWQQQSDAWYVKCAQELPPSRLEEIVQFTFIGGGSGSMSRAEILMHVVNHTTYHRGHVADMMCHLSSPPPTTDLPVFLREDRNQA